MNRIYYLLLLAIVWTSCEVKPQEIAYGKDGCHFCKMTIVDRQHSAQVVTVKGKAFKYDAIECMMNHLNKWDQPEVKYFLVADYSNPGSLTDATKASFLISESIPSPMGEFLTAFETKEERDQTRGEFDGTSLNWSELKTEFNVNQ
ncbi:MAG: nitrous oxide reductase accessory protein NosL [Cyclobacteriaceae bacterium]